MRLAMSFRRGMSESSYRRQRRVSSPQSRFLVESPNLPVGNAKQTSVDQNTIETLPPFRSVLLPLPVGARDFQAEDALVARVNGERIEKSAYERSRGYLEKNLTKQFAGNKLKEELAKRERDVLKTLIDERVLRQGARDLGIEIEAELIKSLDQVRRDNGLDNFEALERFFVAKGVDPREFKNDLEQQLVKERLLRMDAHRQPKSADPGIVEHLDAGGSK